MLEIHYTLMWSKIVLLLDLSTNDLEQALFNTVDNQSDKDGPGGI
jgi:hypothetical protein